MSEVKCMMLNICHQTMLERMKEVTERANRFNNCPSVEKLLWTAEKLNLVDNDSHIADVRDWLRQVAARGKK